MGTTYKYLATAHQNTRIVFPILWEVLSQCASIIYMYALLWVLSLDAIIAEVLLLHDLLADADDHGNLLPILTPTKLDVLGSARLRHDTMGILTDLTALFVLAAK